MQSSEIPQNHTIYINNLNEKVKLDKLKDGLHSIFSQFGKIIEIIALKTLKHRGQAWVVFDEVSAASNALHKMQGFPFFEKPLRIQFAKTKSDCIAKADGTYVPREKRKRHDDRAERKRREQQLESQQAGTHGSAAYPLGYGAPMMGPQMQHPARPNAPEAPAPPNNILFIQNLPHETTSLMLQMLFNQYHGFKEVRLIEQKPGIAFVEYGDEMQATVAMQTLQGFKITPQNPMLISYAKK